MLVRFFALFVLGMSNLSLTYAAPGDPFSVYDLDRILNSRSHTEIEEVLRSLPIEQRSNYTLIHESNSLQGADRMNPRAILYGRDASFIVAFNGNPNYSGYDKLEMIQFNRAEAKFHFFSTYRDPSNSIRLREETKNCTSCHEADLRPNWQPYAHWPGTYGSVDDMLRAREAPASEYSDLQAFLKTAVTHPRYSTLVNLVSGYQSIAGTSRTNLLHNTNFTFRVYILNLQRVARILRETPGYDKYKYAVLGATQCEYIFDSFLPVGSVPPGTVWNRLTSTENAKGTPAFNKVMELWGIDWNSLKMMFHLVNSDPFRGEVFNTSSSPGYEFAGALAEGDPDLQNFTSRHTYTNGGVPAPWATVGFCDSLAKKSRAALTP